MNRRELLTSAGAVLSAGLALNQVLAPVKALAADAKPIRIKAIETFNIEMPATQTEIDAGVMNRAAITRVVTESGVKGYSFGGGGGGGAAGAVEWPWRGLGCRRVSENAGSAGGRRSVRGGTASA